MQTRPIGTPSLQASPIALGCMSLVEGETYGGIDRPQAIATVHAAMDAGITLFDTAPAYGRGAADSVLGEALRDGRRERVLIATKVSTADLSPSDVIRSCEESLRRLQTDRVELLQIHWPDHAIPLGETWAAMQSLKARGLAREIGVCNFGPLDLREVVALGGCVSNQISYNLLMRAVEFEVQGICVDQGLGLLCYSPLAQGLLSGRYPTADDVPVARARSRHFRGDRPKARHGGAGCEELTFRVIHQVVEICRQWELPATDVALAWLLQRPAVSAVLVGASKPGQIQRNLRAAGLTLPPELVAQLDEASLPVKTALGPNLDPWQVGTRVR